MDFGITPQQLSQIVARWRLCAGEVADLIAEGGDLPASGSLFVEALNTCRRTAHTTAGGRARQLDALADALSTFGALTVSADEAAATALADRRRR